MVRQHHQLNGHEFEQTLGDGGGQRKLVYFQPMGSQRRGHDLVTEQQQRVKPKLVRSPPAAGAGVEVFNREDWRQRDFFGCL